MSEFDHGDRTQSAATPATARGSHEAGQGRESVGTIDDATVVDPGAAAASPPASGADTSAWRPVSREAELIAIVTDAERLKALGPKAGWEQRVSAIKHVAEGLSAAENLMLLQRIKRQAAGDTFALAVTPGVRMTAINAASLFRFFEDARRRDTIRAATMPARSSSGAASRVDAPNAANGSPAATPNATEAVANATAEVSAAASKVERATDGKKHTERPAEEYLRHNADAAWTHVALYLENSRFSVPAPGLAWRDSRAFARATVAYLRTMRLFDRHAALLDIAFPLDPYFGILPLLPTTNDWVPAIGDALSQVFEQVIDTSVRRLGPRWKAHARSTPEATGVADETQSLVAAPSLIASAPIDLAVRAGLTHGATVELIEALPLPGKAGKPPPGIRHVELEWVGKADPSLWFCVRASLADATPEEVSAALDREKHGLADGGSTLDAFRLVKMGDVFALPPSWARTFAKVKALGAHGTDERPDLFMSMASSSLADGAALADAKHATQAPTSPTKRPHHAKVQTAATAIDHLTESQIQLAYIAHALGPYQLASEAMAGAPWLARKQVELATATPEQRSEWEPVIERQVKRLHEIGQALKETLGEINGAHGNPQLRKVLAKYAHAASISQFDDASAQLIREAKAEASLATLAAMRSSTNDLTMSVGTGSGLASRDVSRAEELQTENRSLQGKLVRGENVDSGAVEANLVNTQELSLQLKVQQLGGQLGTLDHEIQAAGAGMMSALVSQFDGKFRSLDEVVSAFRAHLRWFDADYESDRGVVEATAIKDPDEHDRAMTKARQARLAKAQARFAAIRNDKDLVHALQNGASIVQRHETATRIAKACGQMLVMIGVGMVASAAGASVARTLATIGEGSEAIEGAAMMARIARGARSVASKVVGAEVEGTINAVGQVAMNGGSFKEAMAENTLMSLGSNLLLSRFGHHLEFAEDIERKSGSLWQRLGSGGAVVLAKGVTITSHVILNAAVAYVAHQIMARGHAEPTSSELSEWFLQGASVAIGRYVHGQLDSRRALRQKLVLAQGVEHAQRLLQDYDRVLRLATTAESAPTDEAALVLLGAHHEMVVHEMTMLESAMSDPAKARALNLAEPALKALHARYGEDLAGLSGVGLSKLPLYQAGLQDVANGDAWRGTQKQIDAAIGHARRAGMQVEIVTDPKTGIQRATVDGDVFDLIVVQEMSPAGDPAVEREATRPARVGAERQPTETSPRSEPPQTKEGPEPVGPQKGATQLVDDLGAAKALPEQHAHEQGSVPIDSVLAILVERPNLTPEQRAKQIELLEELIAKATGAGNDVKVADLSPDSVTVVGGTVKAPRKTTIASVSGSMEVGLLNRMLSAKREIARAVQAGDGARLESEKADLSDALVAYRETIKMQKPGDARYDASINPGDEFFLRYSMILGHGMKAADIAKGRASADQLGMQELRYSPEEKGLPAMRADAEHLLANRPDDADVSLTYATTKKRTSAEDPRANEQAQVVEFVKDWYVNAKSQRMFNGFENAGVEHADRPPMTMWQGAAERTFRNAMVMREHLASELRAPGAAAGLAERLARVTGKSIADAESLLLLFQAGPYEAAVVATERRATELSARDDTLRARRAAGSEEPWRPALPAMDPSTGRLVEQFAGLSLEEVAAQTRSITEALNVWSAETGAHHAEVTTLGMTMHAGEQLLNENISPTKLLDQVDQAISMGTDRIGHGLILGIDPDTLVEKGRLLRSERDSFATRQREVRDRARARGVVIETNMSSNVEISNLTDHQHPAGKFVDEDLRVTVNTDDETVLGTTMAQELRRVSEARGVTRNDLAAMILEGYRSRLGNRELAHRDRIKPALRGALLRGLGSDEALGLVNHLAHYFHVLPAMSPGETLDRVLDVALGM